MSKKSRTVESRTAAVHDVAGVNDKAASPHRRHKIASAGERLSHGAQACQQGLMGEQRTDDDRRAVVLVEAADGLQAPERWTAHEGSSVIGSSSRGSSTSSATMTSNTLSIGMY